MRLRRNGSAFRLELRILNDGPPLFWSAITVIALGLLLCTLVGSLLSLRISTIPVSEVAIGIGFFGSLLLFVAVVLGGAVRYLGQVARRFVNNVRDQRRLPRSLVGVVTGVVIVSVIVTAITCIASLDRVGAGSPEEIGGRYFLINHGERTEVSRFGYTAARAATARFMAVVACVGRVGSALVRLDLSGHLEAECRIPSWSGLVANP